MMSFENFLYHCELKIFSDGFGVFNDLTSFLNTSLSVCSKCLDKAEIFTKTHSCLHEPLDASHPRSFVWEPSRCSPCSIWIDHLKDPLLAPWKETAYSPSWEQSSQDEENQVSPRIGSAPSSHLSRSRG